jgi:hypothetical protein
LPVIIPQLLHNHLSPTLEVCDSPDKAAQYHTVGTELGASSKSVLGRSRSKVFS